MPGPSRAPAAPPSLRADTPDELLLTDLLLTLPEIGAELPRRIVAGDALDAFLLAAAAVQVVEDDLQRDPAGLRRGSGVLGGRAGALALATAGGVERARRLGARRSLRWLVDARTLRDGLADAVMSDTRIAPGCGAAANALVAGIERLPAGARPEPLRLPSCFRSFDLAAADASRLAAGLRCSGPADAVAVVGIRTSGSYLAPLTAAALRADGVDARALTTRPGRPLLPDAAAALREVLAVRRPRVAVVDDPPNSGASYLRTVGLLRARGVPEDALLLLLPLFGDTAPEPLVGLPAVVLPSRDWAVHARLTPAAVATALAELWNRPVESVVRRVGGSVGGEPSGRGHLAARYTALCDGVRHQVEVRGAGQGFLGRHAVAVGAALEGAVPRVHGFRDGLVYAAGPADPDPLDALGPADAAAMGRYVQARAAALPAAADRTGSMAGRQPAWELAARRLARGYGRLGPALRLPLLDPAVRRLCAVEHPSVVDGATGPGHWYAGPGRLLHKADPDTLAFANTDRYCYDPAFDLAGIAPGHPDDAVAAAVRATLPCSDEAFVLYELVHLQDPETGHPTDPLACSRAVRRYLARAYPPPPAGTGPLCALDLDGVLDSDALDFPITTPTSVRTLHAMSRHGFRPVPVTGRSLPEVRERCAAFGLVGGVAEYGAVAYRADTGETVGLLDAAGRAQLDGLRRALAARPGVTVHDEHRHSLRASYRATPGGRPGPVPPEILDAALAEIDAAGLRVIPGARQTDVVDSATDKGSGLRALVELVGGPLALAVGDTAEDLPMLALAQRRAAPGNAEPAVGAAGVRVLHRHYAAGLAAAVAPLLGHRPGGCPTCRVPQPPDPAARLLLTLLDAQAGGRRGLPGAVLRTAARTCR